MELVVKVKSESCVDAIKAVREERSKMNRGDQWGVILVGYRLAGVPPGVSNIIENFHYTTTILYWDNDEFEFFVEAWKSVLPSDGIGWSPLEQMVSVII